MERRTARRGLAAGVSAALAVAVAVLTNVATSGWTWPVGAGLMMLVVGWVGVEAWRAVGEDDHDATRPGPVATVLARDAPSRVVPRQLPPAPRHFAGRVTELETLTGLLENIAGLGARL